MFHLQGCRTIKTLSLLLLLLPHLCFSEVVVIVNANSPLRSLNDLQIRNIYMGNMQYFDSGDRINSINIAEGSAERNTFFKKILKKKDYNYSAYWARMLFVGGKYPPRIAETGKIAKSMVANDINAIAYVDKSLVDDSVRIIYRLTD